MEANVGKELYFLERVIRNNMQVSVNTKCIGVLMPDWLYAQDSVMFDIGFFLPKPVTDLEVNRHGMRVTLFFRGHGFRVHLPWYSIYKIGVAGSEDWMGWPFDAPLPESTTQATTDTCEPTTVQELVAGTAAEPKDNVTHVDFRSKQRQAPPVVDEKEPAE